MYPVHAGQTSTRFQPARQTLDIFFPLPSWNAAAHQNRAQVSQALPEQSDYHGSIRQRWMQASTHTESSSSEDFSASEQSSIS